MTNNGASLLIRAQAGIKIEFTRAVTGDGAYNEEEKTLEALQGRTSLKNQRNSYPISNVEIYAERTVKVTALLTNENPVTHATLITQGYYIGEMGLYAKEQGGTEEVLFSIVVAEDLGDYIPEYDGNSPAQIIQDYFITVNNTADVIVKVANGAVALAEDLFAVKERLDNLILYGPAETYIPPGSTLFVVGDGTIFKAAAFCNMEIRASPNEEGESLGLVDNDGPSDSTAVYDSGIISGKITVADEPDSDAVFFAQINDQ